MIKLKDILNEDQPKDQGSVSALAKFQSGAKRLEGMYSGTVDWKRNFVDVGPTTTTSTGPKRNEKNNPEWATLPSWLKGQGSHPYGDRIWLLPQAARAFLKMKEACKRETGYNIVVTSAYRDVFHQALVSNLNTSGKTGLPVAKVGRSNHGLGLAIDVTRGTAREWMKKNAIKYGWTWYGEGDPPHFNYYPVLMQYGLYFNSAVPKRKLQRYLKKADKKMAKIVLPDIQTAVQKAKNTTPKNATNHYDDIKDSPSTYNYPLLSSENFEAWKDSIDKSTNIPFHKMHPVVLVGDIDSANNIIKKQFNVDKNTWNTVEQLIPTVTVSAKK
jgi:hypothetical protein